MNIPYTKTLSRAPLLVKTAQENIIAKTAPKNLGFLSPRAILFYEMKSLRFSAVLFLCLAAFFSGCGDLDTMLSSGKAYKVNALVNGRSLDECAILSRGSEVSPYFDFNINGDPDIASLVIYLKNYMGKETGVRIKYALPMKDGEYTAESDASSPEPAAVQETSVSGTESVYVSDMAGGSQSGTVSLVTETPAAESTVPAGTVSTDVKDAAPSPEGKDSAETGSESGLSTIESSPAEPPAAGTPSTSEVIVTVENFYDLPSLTFGDDLPFGFYTIVFEVRAANGAVLNSIEKPFFYIDSSRLVIEEIVSYLPGVSSAARIVPPGEKIILEAKMLAEGVTPYIIWYEGKNIISEGYKAEGGDRIFWSSPAQTGFHNIRVEVFPFNPNQMPVMRGLTHDISLPVSQRHGRDGYFAPYSSQLSRWYKLWGNLTDTRDPANAASGLVPAAEGMEIQWQPVSDTYGLKIGTDAVYKIPGAFFKYIRKNEGSGEILFRFAPYDTSAETLILKTDLLITDADGVQTAYPIELSLFEENLVLTVFVQNEQGEVLRAQTPLFVYDDGFISAAIDFQFFDDSIIISIGVENTETASITTWEHITLQGYAESDGVIQFGGISGNSYEETSAAANFIVTDIAVLYPEVSPALILPKDGEDTDDENMETTEIEIIEDAVAVPVED
jgi:hypothetical protein